VGREKIWLGVGMLFPWRSLLCVSRIVNPTVFLIHFWIIILALFHPFLLLDP